MGEYDYNPAAKIAHCHAWRPVHFDKYRALRLADEWFADSSRWAYLDDLEVVGLSAVLPSIAEAEQ